jgi:hypothetical protein
MLLLPATNMLDTKCFSPIQFNVNKVKCPKYKKYLQFKKNKIMVEYKLHYSDVFGRGEFIDILINYVGKPFKYIRIQLEDWPAHESN